MLTITELETALEGDGTTEIIHAAWHAFDVADRLASSIAFDGHSDEHQALLAATHADDGRSLLPYPRPGHRLPTPVPAEGTAWIAPYAALLRRVNAALLRLTNHSELASAAAQLTRAAEEADLCAHLLLTIRQDQGASA